MDTYKLENLEIMATDLDKMPWKDAVKAASDLGQGWRLPTKEELFQLYKNRKIIHGFEISAIYWSSTTNGGEVWVFQFQKNYTWEGDYIMGDHSCKARLVREIKK